MSLIEQAVELLQRAGAQRPVEPRSEPIRKPIGRLVQRRRTLPAADAPAEASAVPCRGDRTVRIDIPALRAAGLIAPQDEERQLAAEYRMIKRPLLAGMTGENRLQPWQHRGRHQRIARRRQDFHDHQPRTESRARARPRGGAGGRRRRQGAHHPRVRSRRRAAAFSTWAPAAASLDETIVRTDYPSLYVLPAGNKNAEATEILRSERTASLLASLAADPRRIVLIDSPPLLVTSEAGVVTSLAGQVVVVVKAAETPQEAVMRAHRNHRRGQTGEPRAEPGRRGTGARLRLLRALQLWSAGWHVG